VWADVCNLKEDFHDLVVWVCNALACMPLLEIQSFECCQWGHYVSDCLKRVATVVVPSTLGLSLAVCNGPKPSGSTGSSLDGLSN